MLGRQVTDADYLATYAKRNIANQTAEHVERVVRNIDAGCDLAWHDVRLPFHVDFTCQARCRRFALQLAEFAAISFQWLILRKALGFSNAWRTMQLCRIDTLNTNGHLAARLDDVLSF